jgi:pyridoxal phosphate-dependent aminotransferase EpsN
MGPDERALLLEAFDSNWIAPLGPQVDAFEQEIGAYLAGRAAAAMSSGTAALHLALVLLGVGPGDEVVAPTLTFVGSVGPVVHLGARPVLLDCEAGTWNLDPALLAELLEARARAGRLPKAVIAVDLYGQCARYEAIAPICALHGVPLIEDAAEALGATRGSRRAGTYGRLAVLSFNGNKIITTAGGGMLLADDPDVAALARKLASQAREPFPHYEHTVVGYNYRLSNLLAAVGRGQLRVLEARVAARRANFEWYTKHLGGLPGMTMMPIDAGGESNYWLSVVLVDPERFGADRESLRVALEAAQIEARPIWKPMHLQPVFRGAQRVGGQVAEALFERGLCLPSGSSLTPADRERILEVILGLQR